MAEAGSKAQVLSSRPSLSLPVFDSARSAREGSFPSFSRKLCMRFLLLKLPSSSQRWKSAKRISPTGLQKPSLILFRSGQNTPTARCCDVLHGGSHHATQVSISDLASKIQTACLWHSYFLFSYKYQMQWTTT